ncbi:DUF4173 domain-containing protein [Kineosporia sp. J2-2]|uniref:DUF4173 domain-containing protein n=1 Tax=Kineosporia corallincola TaxID=2835133 RepID=A0ABS5TKI0_9ACTN|nr:DUF4153 domain-containing protein [Kineosporia corallincola]MBT0771605.1 DUF4173 domain-containing protein [Kineosporia corallincola]
MTRTWPDPAPPRLRLPLGALATGVVAALLLPDAAPGLNVVLVAVAAAATVLLSVRSRAGHDGRRGRLATALTVISSLLAGVAVVRASEWLVAGCVLAAAALGAAVAVGARRWPAVLATGWLFGESVIRSVPWVGETLRRRRPRGVPVRAPRAVLTGLAVGLVCTVVIGALLASADAGFADLLGGFGDLLVIDVPGVDVLVARVLVGAVVALGVLGTGFAASTRLRQEPAAPRDRHPAEWLTPLVLVAVTIAAFLAVEAGRLSGVAGTVNHAERARQGFGQLVVVTVLVLLLVAWAGRSAGAGHRGLLAAGGGTLLALTLLLAVSALRRLWLYQGEFGWTVARFNGGAFELWVVVVLLTVAVAWTVRRADLLPRLVAGSAGLGLLVVALAGPDAVVAAANVRRYQSTGDIDTLYLSRLSADAVPALTRLPEPVRACALPDPDAEEPWYSWNFSRFRAQGLLEQEGLTAGDVADRSGCAGAPVVVVVPAG